MPTAVVADADADIQTGSVPEDRRTMSRGADTTSTPATPQVRWHRRIVQALLYGRNVDRGKKAKARLGLAIVAFAVVYLVIGGTAGALRRRPGCARRAPGAGPAIASRPRGPIFSTAMAKCWRAT